MLLVVDLGWLADPRGVIVVVELGVVATAIAYILYTAALVWLPVSHGATLSLAEPLTASLLGTLLLGESLAPIQLVGATLVAAGLLALALTPTPS